MRYTPDSLTEKLQKLHYHNCLQPYLDELTQPQLLGVCSIFQCGKQKLARDVLIRKIVQEVDATPLMSVQLDIVLPSLETESDLNMLLGDWHAQA